MNIKDFKAHLEAEQAERDIKVWYKKYFLNFLDFIWYRVFLRAVEWPYEIKCKYQEWTKGYADRDVWGLNNYIINKVRAPLKEFVRYQAEEGFSLPNEFETDPAAWLEILQKIEFAFNHEWSLINETNYRPYHNLTEDERNNHTKRVNEGFELFGKHLRALWE